ncbi:MAG: hypothetical protein AABX63_05195, partial [Nanoarchaeota archaeon]
KRGQGMSITVIVAAVIGLIILVVVIAMLTGKLGGFSKGVSAAGGCDSICKAVGYGGGGNVNHPELKFEGTACDCAS